MPHAQIAGLAFDLDTLRLLPAPHADERRTDTLAFAVASDGETLHVRIRRLLAGWHVDLSIDVADPAQPDRWLPYCTGHLPTDNDRAAWRDLDRHLYRLASEDLEREHNRLIRRLETAVIQTTSRK